MSREALHPDIPEEFMASQERFIPLAEFLDDPRLDPSTRLHYESLLQLSGGKAFVREYIPADLEAAPITEIVLGDLDTSSRQPET